MDDQPVIARVKAGDIQAFSILVEKYHRRLLAFIHRHVGDENLVEDIGQEVFLDVYKSLKDFDPGRGTPFSAWLFIAARNRCMSELRKKNGAVVVSIEETDVAGLGIDSRTAESLLVENERRSAVLASLARMSEQLRQPILMSLRGSSLSEIAEACGVSASAAKSRLFRARAKLRLLLGKRFGGRSYEGI